MTPSVSSLAGHRVVVAGAGRSGVAAVRAALDLGAVVTVTDPTGGLPADLAGAVTVVPELDAPPAGTDLVITSPGLRPTHPLLRSALDVGLEVISEVEFGWRIAEPPRPDWLAVTGTDGKTTTVGMLSSMLQAGGLSAVAAGNIGDPVTDAVRARPAHAVLAVELSSAQLHFCPTIQPVAAAILNLVPDHLDWHGTFEAYAADKGSILRPGATAVVNADDPAVVALAADCSDVVAFTLGEPANGQLGVVGDSLVDRAFDVAAGAIGSAGGGVELARCGDIPVSGRHNVANALAAAALARRYGVPPKAIAAGLRAYLPAPHRNAVVGVVAGVSYVDDSKATNPHAAAGSLTSYPRVVWIAGGQLKDIDVTPLVESVRRHLVGAVLIGVDRARIADAIARHAPDLPVVDVSTSDDGAMTEAVRAAARLAGDGDTVLLAPAGASFDMFTDYAARGDAFAAAVRMLEGE